MPSPPLVGQHHQHTAAARYRQLLVCFMNRPTAPRTSAHAITVHRAIPRALTLLTRILRIEREPELLLGVRSQNSPVELHRPSRSLPRAPATTGCPVDCRPHLMVTGPTLATARATPFH